MAISVLKRIFSAGVLLLCFNCAGQKKSPISPETGHYSGYGRADCGCAYSVDVDDLCGGWFRCKNCGMHPSARGLPQQYFKNTGARIEKVNSTFVNKDFTINGEELVRLNPDLVIIWDYQKEEKEKLDKLGIPAVAIRYGDLDDVKNGIRLLGDILGKEKRAADLLAFLIIRLSQ